MNLTVPASTATPSIVVLVLVRSVTISATKSICVSISSETVSLIVGAPVFALSDIVVILVVLGL